MEELKEQVNKLRREGKSIRDISKDLSVPKSTVQRLVSQLNGTVEQSVPIESGTVKEIKRSVPKKEFKAQKPKESMTLEDWKKTYELYKSTKDCRLNIHEVLGKMLFGTEKIKEVLEIEAALN